MFVGSFLRVSEESQQSRGSEASLERPKGSGFEREPRILACELRGDFTQKQNRSQIHDEAAAGRTLDP